GLGGVAPIVTAAASTAHRGGGSAAQPSIARTGASAAHRDRMWRQGTTRAARRPRAPDYHSRRISAVNPEGFPDGLASPETPSTSTVESDPLLSCAVLPAWIGILASFASSRFLSPWPAARSTAAGQERDEAPIPLAEERLDPMSGRLPSRIIG